jgi:hypothetical protein
MTISLIYCKPTFIHKRENFARFARTSVSRIFLVANQMYYQWLCSSVWMEKAWSWNLFVANQFITEESWNKVATNKSWFTVMYLWAWNKKWGNLQWWYNRKTNKGRGITLQVPAILQQGGITKMIYGHSYVVASLLCTIHWSEVCKIVYQYTHIHCMSPFSTRGRVYIFSVGKNKFWNITKFQDRKI